MFGTSWRVARDRRDRGPRGHLLAVIALLITYSMLSGLDLYPSCPARAWSGSASWRRCCSSVRSWSMSWLMLVAQALGPGPGHHPVPVRRRDTGQGRVPRADEFLIALVGPLTSGLLLPLFGIVAGLGGDALSAPLVGIAWLSRLDQPAAGRAQPRPGIPAGRWAAAAFGHLEGHRCLSRATRIALLSARPWAGCWSPAGLPSLAAGDLAGGIWFAFIGGSWFQAARSSYQELQLQQLLRRVGGRGCDGRGPSAWIPPGAVAAGRRGLLHAL